MNQVIAFVHEQLTPVNNFPKFKAGDNVTVNYKIIEGSKERIQSFKGDVIKRQGTTGTATFTVGKCLMVLVLKELSRWLPPTLNQLP